MLNFLRSGQSRNTAQRPEKGQLGFRIAPDVKASVHPAGVVLIHLGRGTVFSANRAGAVIWNGAAEQWSLDRLAATVSDEFQIPLQAARQDAAEFLAELTAEGLLISDSILR